MDGSGRSHLPDLKAGRKKGGRIPHQTGRVLDGKKERRAKLTPPGSTYEKVGICEAPLIKKGFQRPLDSR